MPVSPNYLSYVLDQLTALGAVRSRRMFGGIGLYSGELFFGLIDDDVVYFKVDDSNRADYTSRGCKAFKPFEGVVSMNYYRVPEEILEEADDVRAWARKALLVAAAAATAKAPKKKPKPANKKRVAKPTRAKTPPVARAKKPARTKK